MVGDNVTERVDFGEWMVGKRRLLLKGVCGYFWEMSKGTGQMSFSFIFTWLELCLRVECRPGS